MLQSGDEQDTLGAMKRSKQIYCTCSIQFEHHNNRKQQFSWPEVY